MSENQRLLLEECGYATDPYQTDDEYSDEDDDQAAGNLSSDDDFDWLFGSSDSDFDFDENDDDGLVGNLRLLSRDKAIQYSQYEVNVEEEGGGASKSYKGTGRPTVQAAARVVDPLSAFLLFIEPIEKSIVQMTNLYGEHKYENQWEKVDVAEMRVYYGILLLAGVLRGYGETTTELFDELHGRPVFSEAMPLKRYQEITECLRFDDRRERQNLRTQDKFAAIRSIFEKWMRRVKSLYRPGRNVVVAQDLLPYRGKCPFIQRVKSNAFKYGIKQWILCDAATSYVYNVEIFTGRDQSTVAGNANQESEDVVLRLTSGLSRRNVVCDKYLTSQSLAAKLKDQQMTIVGEIRKDREELPPVLLDMKQKPLHHSEFVFNHELGSTLVSYVTKKRRFTTLLSTMPTKKRINLHDPEKKPEILNLYNARKRSMEKVTEAILEYRCKPQVNRWPLAIFCNILDISAFNAFVMFTDLNPYWKYGKKKTRRRLFLMEIGQSLVAPAIEKNKRLSKEEDSSMVEVCSHDSWGFCDKCVTE